ncbi:MAG TPA: hypothetical protein VLN74_02885 [Ilumatobacteraceae bacterium]|nr:hypothetical protein [Ilumatobacteraceae bacterium]
MLASLLLVGAVLFVGLGTGVSASTVSTAVPVGPMSTVEDPSDTKVDNSTRRAADHRVMTHSVVGGDFASPTGTAALVEQQLVRWLRLAPPSWRGPPVLLI